MSNISFDEIHEKYGHRFKSLLDKYRYLISIQIYDYLKNRKLRVNNILDFGTSGDIFASNQTLHGLVNKLKIQHSNVYCCGIENFDNISKKIDYNFINISENEKLPFEENFFDLVHCHAVYEHIENDVAVFYLNEMVRVGKKVIITVPNRYFPLDWHLMFPFMGFLPRKIIYKIIKIFPFGAWKYFNKKNLQYISKNDLKNISLNFDNKNINSILEDKVIYTGIKFGCFSSNLSRLIFK